MSAITITPASLAPITVRPSNGVPVRVELVPTAPVIVSGVAGIPGPAGRDATGEGVTRYEHIQPIPATVWVIAHNLGFRPSVTALSTGGLRMDADIQHLSQNVLTVTFLISVAGSAHLV